MTSNDDKIKLNNALSIKIIDSLDKLNRQIDYNDISTEISFDDLDKQLEFYNRTLNEFELLNHDYILKIEKQQKNINKLTNEIKSLKDKNNDLVNANNSLNENNRIISNQIKIEKQRNNDLDYLKKQYKKILIENKNLKNEINKRNSIFKRIFK